MAWIARSRRYLTALMALSLLGAAAPSSAGDSRVPMPSFMEPTNAEQCVEPTDFMRRNHMNLILHQRDETMHKGIRTTKYSLKQCINCHAADYKGGSEEAQAQHFCVSCHQYAAVQPDCFQCHSLKPETTK